MASAIFDLVIEKGETYEKTFYWKDTNKVAINMSGYTARMQARSSSRAANTILNLTTENGGITITPLEGKIELTISDTVTSAIAVSSGVYDLELIDASSKVKKFLRGTITFLKETTK